MERRRATRLAAMGGAYGDLCALDACLGDARANGFDVLVAGKL